ncbi:MAG TPA: HNH endonuclease, partial [Aquella sp.]|nr:HNH endonuclease [Aquella sp.]
SESNSDERDTTIKSANKLLQPRKLTESMKRRVAGCQYFRCANSPGKQLRSMGDFECPLWRTPGNHQGNFDESGYEIDHIVEFSISGDDSKSNLQALCLSCHRVKTVNFISELSQNKKDNKIKQTPTYFKKSNKFDDVKKPTKSRSESYLDDMYEDAFDISSDNEYRLALNIPYSDNLYEATFAVVNKLQPGVFSIGKKNGRVLNLIRLIPHNCLLSRTYHQEENASLIIYVNQFAYPVVFKCCCKKCRPNRVIGSLSLTQFKLILNPDFIPKTEIKSKSKSKPKSIIKNI